MDTSKHLLMRKPSFSSYLLCQVFRPIRRFRPNSIFFGRQCTKAMWFCRIRKHPEDRICDKLEKFQLFVIFQNDISWLAFYVERTTQNLHKRNSLLFDFPKDVCRLPHSATQTKQLSMNSRFVRLNLFFSDDADHNDD